MTESIIGDFMYENNLKCIVIKDKTCFENPNNPSSLDLFLTNLSNCFQNTTGALVIRYRCYKILTTFCFVINLGLGFPLQQTMMNLIKYICKF